MKKFLILLLGAWFVATQAIASTDALQITPEIVLKAISVFRSNPIDDDADSILSIVVRFAQTSSKVLVEIDETMVPYKPGSIDQDASAKFVGAFIAGNIEYQLNNDVKENRPCEGIELMIITYEVMRNANLVNRIEGFEDWITLRDKGELKSICAT